MLPVTSLTVKFLGFPANMGEAGCKMTAMPVTNKHRLEEARLVIPVGDLEWYSHMERWLAGGRQAAEHHLLRATAVVLQLRWSARLWETRASAGWLET